MQFSRCTFIISIFLCLFRGVSIAQPVNTDSLINIVQSAPEDTNKVIAYRILCGVYAQDDPRLAMSYGWQGIELGKKLAWGKGVAGCYLNLGNCYSNLGIYDSAIAMDDSALVYSLQARDPNRIALVYINRAAVYIYMNKFDKAMHDAQAALPYAEQSKNQDRIARVYMTLGNISFYQEAWEKSIEYYKKCLPLFEEANAMDMVATCNLNISTSYKNLHDPKKSVRYIEDAIDLLKDQNDAERLMMAYLNGGEAYLQLEDYGKAELYYTNGAGIAASVEDNEKLVNFNHALGELFIHKKEYVKAESILLPALDSARSYNYINSVSSITKSLSELYSNTGKFDKAFLYLKDYMSAKDTIEARKQKQKIDAMRADFKAEENENKRSLLQSQTSVHKLQAERKKLLNNILVGGSVAFIIVVVLILSRASLKRKYRRLQIRHNIFTELAEDISGRLGTIKLLSEVVSNQVRQKDPAVVSMLDKIAGTAKELAETTGDIVWMTEPGNNKFGKLESRMIDFAYGISADKNIALHISKDEKLDALLMPMGLCRDIYLIFKDAVYNAVQHSGAKTIEVNYKLARGVFYMTVSDNGKGYDEAKVKKGKGIEDIIGRSGKNNGKVEIKSVPGQGTTIAVMIPIP